MLEPRDVTCYIRSGKHKRKTMARIQSAKKRMKAYRDKVREEKSDDVAPQPKTLALPPSFKKNGAVHRGNSSEFCVMLMPLCSSPFGD